MQQYQTIIQPKSGWRLLDFKEIKAYRDLFFFMVWRDIKVHYAQTILGFLWAIFEPTMQILIFSIVFGKVAKLQTEGIPYVLFATVAIVPWTYMSQAMTQSSQCLVAQQNILGKVYFPRIIFPVTPILSLMVNFSISMLIIIFVAIYYKIHPTWNLLAFPLAVLNMVTLSAGVGFWLSTMAIRFRDVKHAMPFVIRMLMYTAPIVYSASSISEKYRLIYSLNPIVSVIETFRSAILGSPMPWTYIYPGMLVTAVLLLTGLLYFNRMESIFVDVI